MCLRLPGQSEAQDRCSALDILRRLGSYRRKNKLDSAFRERVHHFRRSYSSAAADFAGCAARGRRIPAVLFD
jgi:hypothetical protein